MAGHFSGYGADGIRTWLCGIRDGVLKLIRDNGPNLGVELDSYGYGEKSLVYRPSGRPTHFCWAMIGPKVAGRDSCSKRIRACSAQVGIHLWGICPGDPYYRDSDFDAYKPSMALRGTQAVKLGTFPPRQPTKLFFSRSDSSLNSFARKNGMVFEATTLLCGDKWDWACRPTEDFAEVRAACKNCDWNGLNFTKPITHKETGTSELTKLTYEILVPFLREFPDVFESSAS